MTIHRMSYDSSGQQVGGQAGLPGQFAVPAGYGTPPPAYLGWATAAIIGGALFNTILGVPAGLLARRQGRRVRTLWQAGDQQGAIRASRTARLWVLVSTALDGLGVVVLALVIALGGIGSQSPFHSPSAVAASLKTLIQKRLSDPASRYYSPGVKVNSVVCTRAGANTDTCTFALSNGRSDSVTAVISADGRRYVTR
jgi:hypothetical protein